MKCIWSNTPAEVNQLEMEIRNVAVSYHPFRIKNVLQKWSVWSREAKTILCVNLKEWENAHMNSLWKYMEWLWCDDKLQVVYKTINISLHIKIYIKCLLQFCNNTIFVYFLIITFYSCNGISVQWKFIGPFETTKRITSTRNNLFLV